MILIFRFFKCKLVLLKKLVPKKVKMVTTCAKNYDDSAVVPLVTQDVVHDEEYNPSVSPIILFPEIWMILTQQKNL